MVNVADLVGLPYKVHGRDVSGLDCFGLIWLIAKRNGTPIKDPDYKGFDPSLEIEREGRLHLGYSIDNERMIHCAINEGVIVESIFNYKVKGYYKFK